MATRQAIIKRYQRILTAWPVDLLRPDIPFQNVIKQRLAIAEGTAKTAAAKQVTGNEAQVIAAKPQEYDVKKDLEQVNALNALMDDRFMKKFPLTEHMLNPTSSPNHYSDLIKELEEAPKRSWLQAKLQQWRSRFRFT